MTHHIKMFAAAVLLFFSAQQSKGFALLGPYANWMQPTNGFRSPGDIGGPMNLDEEYRWNVPLLTYGFDQSFLDYFGSNGVSAVEQAFQILNDLPPASLMSLEDFPSTPRINSSAELQKLLDVKTMVLDVMLEQLGLAQPQRNVFVLRSYDPVFEIYPDEFMWPEGVIPTFVLERNFDPELLSPSHSVNESLFTGAVFRYPNMDYADAFESLLDPSDSSATAIADLEFGYGKFFTGLSADDAGGLRYLLHTNNVNYETLLPDVHGTTNLVFVNAALRPGINKITFVRQPFDSPSQQWIPVTNQFTDTYLTNGQPAQQTLAREVAQPDFLFSAGDTGSGQSFSPLVLRTGTTNWQNNGISGALGPGVIRPPIHFTFEKFPQTLFTSDYFGAFISDDVKSDHWASFDETTNFTVYPVATFQETNSFKIRFLLNPNTIEWHPNIAVGGTVLLKTSTNLTNWITVTSVTNAGGIFEWSHQRSSSPNQRFFRVIPE